MTSFAAGKMVIATNVGAFPEYIYHNENGVLTEPNANDLADAIIDVLNKEKYKEIEKNIATSYSSEIGSINQKCILKAYNN